MDGSLLAVSYNGNITGSMVGSTFDEDVGDAISPHAGLTSTEGSQVSLHDIERNFDTIDPPNTSKDNPSMIYSNNHYKMYVI